MEILGRDLGVEGEYNFIEIIYYALLYSEVEHKFKMDALDSEGLYEYPSQNDSYQLIDFCTADEYKSFEGLLNDAEIKVEKESLYNIRSYWAMHKFYVLTEPKTHKK